MADLLFASHYPFSSEAKEWVKQVGMQINSDAVALGEQRAEACLKDGAIPQRASELEADLRAEVLSYAASRVIAACMSNRFTTSRLAVGEAKRASAYLRSASDQSNGYVEKVAMELSLHFEPSGQAYFLPVWEYLLNTPRSIDYKLTVRELAGGRVKVSGHQRLRIIEEAVRKRVEGAPLPKLKEWPTEVKEAAARLVKLLPKEDIAPSAIATEDFPPCIHKLIEDLRTSVNVPHNGRYALAIYMVRAGLPDEQIVKLFQNAPDFSPETTAYQVKYIRQKGYSMPSCSTMDTYGTCIADCRCGTPTNFRKKTHGTNAEKSKVLQE